MAARRNESSKGRLAHLWQLPLLVLSLGLFAFAAYLFIDPKPGLSVDQKIDLARTHLRHDRPEAAIDQLNTLLTDTKMERATEARVHLLLAEAIDAGQRQRRVNLVANHQQIVSQTEVALAQGAKADVAAFRRLGESYESLDQSEQALKAYRRAEALDPNRALSLQRKIIQLQTAQGSAADAEAALDRYIEDTRLSDGERAWAYGEKAHLLTDAGDFLKAKALLGEALRLDPDPTSQGQTNYQLGYCEWKLGNVAEAERLLRLARDRLKVRHPIDADAAYALGRIRMDRNDPEEAIAFFEAVLLSHPEAAVAPLSRLGRGICRIMLGQDEAGLADLRDLVAELEAKFSRQRYKPEAIAGLRRSESLLSGRENFRAALDVLAYEQVLQPKPDPEFFARLATVYERRAEQVNKTVNTSPTTEEKARRTRLVEDLRTKAGDAHLAHAKALTTDDDKAYGESIWKAVELYDKAGSVPLAIAALELFVAERPSDGLAPDAWLRLGRSYHVAGQLDKAINAYQHNQFRYPQSLAASKSGVPLAQALVLKGPDYYPKAEAALKAVLDNNPLITPEAEEFREALFELAKLYYATDRFEEAVARFEEMSQRYADDRRTGQTLFLMADSYRKSAALLRVPAPAVAATRPAEAQAEAAAPDTRIASADRRAIPAPAQQPARRPVNGAAGGNAAPAPSRAFTETRETREARERLAAKRDRLTAARKLYDRVIEHYRSNPPADEQDRQFLKYSHFYRADCAYDLGGYAEAIGLYEAAALRYQGDPSSLAAHVQIVNCHVATGRIDEAKAANERAKVLLRQMPKDAFDPGKSTMSKEYWEQWLKWTTEAGLY